MTRSGGAFSVRRALRLQSLVARGGTVPSALGILLGVVLAASVPGGVATARPTASASTLDQQAQQLQAQIVSDGSALHDAALALSAARTRDSEVAGQLSSDQANLSTLQAKLGQADVTLRAIAINQYMEDTDATTDLSVFTASPMEAAATTTYEEMATATTTDALDGYRMAAAAVQREETALAGEQAADAADAQAVTHQYAVLTAALQTENSALSRVREQQMALATGPPDGAEAAYLLGADSSLAEDLYRLRECESSDNYQDDTGNGYYGAYQFALSTWEGLGYGGLPSQAPPPEQDQAAIRLEQSRGWGQWPACAAMLGLD